MLSAIQIGAGNIGRGFLGQIYAESGYATTFIEYDRRLAEKLAQRGAYPLRLVSSDGERRDVNVGNVAAIASSDQPAECAQIIAECDICGTSVGVRYLSDIAPILATAINFRASLPDSRPLDILLCENQANCASIMRGLIAPYIRPEASDYFSDQVGLVETTICRMVPTPTYELTAEDPLLMLAEPYMELPVAKDMFKGSIPELVGLIPVDRFEAYEHRKLYMHNASHAALGYLGFRAGHEYIWECVADPRVRDVCVETLQEVESAMTAAYPGVDGMDRLSLAYFSADLVKRFGNKALGDTVLRVAADPLRKLRPDDRLVGAAKFCEAYAVPPNALAQVIGAAMEFDSTSDASAMKLQSLRKSYGDAKALEYTSGIDEDSALGRMVLDTIARTSRR